MDGGYSRLFQIGQEAQDKGPVFAAKDTKLVLDVHNVYGREVEVVRRIAIVLIVVGPDFEAYLAVVVVAMGGVIESNYLQTVARAEGFAVFLGQGGRQVTSESANPAPSGRVSRDERNPH